MGKKRKVLLLSESISVPFDEGLKNVLYNVANKLREICDLVVLTRIGNVTDSFECEKVKLGKTFLNFALRQFIIRNKPELILYVPEASATFNSFIRCFILKSFAPWSKLGMVVSQKRRIPKIILPLLRILRPDLIFLLSRDNNDFYSSLGAVVRMLPPAIDVERFRPISHSEKCLLRNNFGLSKEKKIILHVGHINPDRNLESLLPLSSNKEFQVVVVGSTTTRVDNKLKNRLQSFDVVIIDRFLPNIEQVYQLADVYVFPVKKETAAISMPLSILEAMACNLPVVTTKFFGIKDIFIDDDTFKFYDNDNSISELINDVLRTKPNNREKVIGLNWGNLANSLISVN